MEQTNGERNIPVFLHSETAVPRRRIVRNDAALYLLLLFGAVGCIALSRWLSVRFGVLRLVFQLVLYALLFGTGYVVYRLRLVSYRYTLTTAALEVRQLVGQKDTLLLEVPLDEIIELGIWTDGKGRYDGRTFIGRRSEALCIVYRGTDGTHALCISASDTLHKLLSEQIHVRQNICKSEKNGAEECVTRNGCGE